MPWPGCVASRTELEALCLGSVLGSPANSPRPARWSGLLVAVPAAITDPARASSKRAITEAERVVGNEQRAARERLDFHDLT